MNDLLSAESSLVELLKPILPIINFEAIKNQTVILQSSRQKYIALIDIEFTVQENRTVSYSKVFYNSPKDLNLSTVKPLIATPDKQLDTLAIKFAQAVQPCLLYWKESHIPNRSICFFFNKAIRFTQDDANKHRQYYTGSLQLNLKLSSIELVNLLSTIQSYSFKENV